jgi:hypothetical protein
MLTLHDIAALAGEYELVTEQPTCAAGGLPLRTLLRLRWAPQAATLAGEEEYEGVQPGSLIRQPVALSDTTLLIGNPKGEGGPSRYEILESTPDGFRGTWRTYQPRWLRESKGSSDEWAIGAFRAIRHASDSAAV